MPLKASRTSVCEPKAMAMPTDPGAGEETNDLHVEERQRVDEDGNDGDRHESAGGEALKRGDAAEEALLAQIVEGFAVVAAGQARELRWLRRDANQPS